MCVAISRESRASDIAVAQNMFTISDGIIMLSGTASDLVNIFDRFKNLHLKKADFLRLYLDENTLKGFITFVCYNLIYAFYINKKH